MCQLIVKPAGKLIPKNILEKCWDRNPDGAGFAFKGMKDDKETLFINKGFFTFGSFYEAYEPYEQLDCLIHFRIATHGSKCKDNCHPFSVIQGVVMGHNGVLRDFLPGANDDRSDTRIFAEDYIRKILESLSKGTGKFFVPTLAWMLEPLIGMNKLVFMTVEGFTIVNEKLGDWEDGAWYSNGIPQRTWYYHTPDENGEWITEPTQHGGYWRRWVADDARIYDSKTEAWMTRKEQKALRAKEALEEDGIIDAAIKNGDNTVAQLLLGSRNMITEEDFEGEGNKFTSRDIHVMAALNKADEYETGNIGDEEWRQTLAELSPIEWTEFLHLYAEGDPEVQTILIAERESGQEERDDKLAKQRKAIENTVMPYFSTDSGMVTYPPWLNREFKFNEKMFSNVERAYLVGTKLMSRSEAQRSSLLSRVPLPKGKGVWRPIYEHDTFFIKDWELAGEFNSDHKIEPKKIEVIETTEKETENVQ